MISEFIDLVNQVINKLQINNHEKGMLIDLNEFNIDNNENAFSQNIDIKNYIDSKKISSILHKELEIIDLWYGSKLK